MSRHWSREGILEQARGYRQACVLTAAAELDLFGHFRSGGMTAVRAAERMGCDPRGLTILLDALAALDLMVKNGEEYSAPTAVAEALGTDGPGSVLAMARHQGNLIRLWSELARVVKTGRPAERRPSLRGATADMESFIAAMNDVSAHAAGDVVRSVVPPEFRRLLDVGGGPGTWTAAFLDVCPGSTAILFDLPDVVPLAENNLAARGLMDRVTFVAGDYLADPLPEGADLVWLSAIVHQNTRAGNRKLFAAAHRALPPGGRVAIRDILMEPSRTAPAEGALFAVNMLVATSGGGTFTFDEIREDLEGAGFAGVTRARREEGMSSIVVATRPA